MTGHWWRYGSMFGLWLAWKERRWWLRDEARTCRRAEEYGWSRVPATPLAGDGRVAGWVEQGAWTWLAVARVLTVCSERQIRQAVLDLGLAETEQPSASWWQAP